MPAFITDRAIRHRFRCTLEKLPLERFSIRVAHTTSDYKDAFQLLWAAYTYKGYLPVCGPTMHMTAHHVLPESTVLIASAGEQVVGTMTVTVDSPAGLPLDKDYPQELSALREDGARLAEFGSLAVLGGYRSTGLTTLINMAAFWFTRHIARASHVAIGINPRAVPWHRAIYGFELMDQPREHATLAAPVQGMVVTEKIVEQHLARWFKRPLPDGSLLSNRCFELTPACVELPRATTLEQLVRWKLPRDVFRELFIHKSNRLEQLDTRTRNHLEGWRSIKTVGHRATIAQGRPEHEQT